MNIATATPVEIDTKLSEFFAKRDAAFVEFNRQTRYLESNGYERHYFDQDKLDVAKQTIGDLNTAVAMLNDEFIERGGWTRYYHVTNNNGHIHRSLYCSSCFPDTQYAWRTDLSGLTEEEVVAREAYNACSVCMPIAPAEQKAARERYNAEQRAQRKAEKDAKANAKADKARQRAVKLVDKVEAAIEKLGGLDTFRNDYSLYGHDGRKSVYDAVFDMQTTVGDTLHAMKQLQDEGSVRVYDMNDYVKAELTKRGLI